MFPNESDARHLQLHVRAADEGANQRVSLVVAAKSPIERILEFTRNRGWRNLRFLSSSRNSWARSGRR